MNKETHLGPQPTSLPSKEMLKSFNELVKSSKTFRVVDVEKITGNDFFGMLWARKLTEDAKRDKIIQWNYKPTKHYEVLKNG